MLDNSNSNIALVRRSYSATELRFKTNKALYLSGNLCEVPIIIIRVLVLLYARLNLSKGLSPHKGDCKEHFVDFAYGGELEVQLELHDLVFKLVAFPVEYV